MLRSRCPGKCKLIVRLRLGEINRKWLAVQNSNLYLLLVLLARKNQRIASNRTKQHRSVYRSRRLSRSVVARDQQLTDIIAKAFVERSRQDLGQREAVWRKLITRNRSRSLSENLIHLIPNMLAAVGQWLCDTSPFPQFFLENLFRAFLTVVHASNPLQ